MKNKVISILVVMSLLYTLVAPMVLGEGSYSDGIQGKIYLEEEVSFDGTDQAVKSAPAEDLSFYKGLGSVTLTTSFKTSNSGLQALMALNGNNNPNDYITFYINAGNTVGMEIRDYSGATQVNQHLKSNAIPGINLADGEWHTATLTISENQYLRFYVDQKLVLDSTTNKTYFSKDTTWDISSFTMGGAKRISGNSYLFSGSMKDVKAYNGALTEEEILDDHGYIPAPELPEPIFNLTNMDFDGTNNSFVFADDYVEKLKGMDKGTFSFDLKLDENSYDNVIGGLFSLSNKNSENDYATIYIKPSSNKIGIETIQGLSKEFDIPENLSLNNERWHTVTYVFTGTQMSIYIDGHEVGTAEFAGLFSSLPWINTADSATVGGMRRTEESYAWPFNGTIVKATAFEVALTQEEVQAFAKNTNPDALTFYNENTFKSQEYGLFDMGDHDTYNFRIPALVTLSDGTMIASADQRKTHWSDWGNIDTVLKKSSDGGKTWTDIVDVIDLKEQPYFNGTQATFSIDPCMMVETQGENKDRVWILITTFPESGGTWAAQAGTGYTEIDGKQYQTLYDAGGNTYTLREEGKVYDSNNELTDYTVKQNSVQPFNDMGDMYKNGEYVGNIYLKSNGVDNDSAPLTVYVTSYLWLTYSDDAGESWSTPRDINPMVKEDWMKFCGVGPGTGLQIEDGTLIFPVYYTTKNVGGGLGFQSSANVYSTDGGETWQRGESPNDGRINNQGIATDSKNPSGISELTESQIIELNNGHLMQFMRNTGGNGKVVVSVSKDKGLTWGPVVDTSANDVYCQLSVVHYPELVDGKEIVIMSNPGGSARNNGTLRIGEIGEDDSITWTTTKRFRPGNYAYSCLTLMPDNTFGLMYEHANTIKFTSFNLDYIKDEKNIISPNIIGVSKEVIKGESNPEDMIVAGDTLVFTVTTDQTVFAKGQPQLRFQIAGENRFADFVSGGTSNNYLVFKYVVEDFDDGSISFRPKIVNDTKNAIQNVYGLDISSIDTIFSLGKVGFDASIDTRDIPANQMTATAGTAQAGEGPELVLDNNSATIWHTPWTSAGGDVSRDKFWIQFDLKDVYDVDGLRYQPRQGGGTNGIITKYRVDVSLDGGTWTEVDAGTWLNNSEWKLSRFTKIKAKYVRLVALESVSNSTIGFASAAEIRLTGDLADIDVEPPTTPSLFKADNVTKTTALLSWGASTDDVGVAGYTLKQGATEIATLDGSALSYELSNLAPNTEYTFDLYSFDEALNRSETATVSFKTLKPVDPVEVDLTAINEKLASVASLIEADYTVDSWSSLQTVVDEAEALIANASATQTEIDAMTLKLQSAVEGLEEKPVDPDPGTDLDTSLLEFMITEADKQVEDGALVGLIEAVVERFNKALKEAKAILVKADIDPTSVTQAEIDFATKNLIDALHMLDFKGTKGLLQNLVAKCERYVADKALYSKATYDVFEAALEEAKTVLADKTAFQDEIDKAWFDLATGLAGLRKIPNKDALKGLLDKARSINPSQYTAVSFRVLVDAVDDANIVFGDTNATVEAVVSSEKAVKTAMDGLVPLVATTTDDTATDGTTTTTKASDSDKVVKVADTTTKAATSVPKTGENSLAMLLFTLFSLSCVVTVVIRKKKVK